MPKFQIRDDDFGLALVEAEDGREALLEFIADRVKGQVRATVEENVVGHAEVVYDGVRYRAIPAT